MLRERITFSKLRYPNTLVNSTIRRFMQETDRAPHAMTSSEPSVYIKLPFKDQRSADPVRNEINSLGSMINVNVKPVFTSRKLSQTLSVKEKKPPIVNTQCVVYSFQCIREHRYSAIGKHVDTQHDNKRAKIDHLFKVLKKCRSKFDCLIYEILFIKDMNSSLNT